MRVELWITSVMDGVSDQLSTSHGKNPRFAATFFETY
jgi:hypothetical protein